MCRDSQIQVFLTDFSQGPISNDFGQWISLHKTLQGKETRHTIYGSNCVYAADIDLGRLNSLK